MNRSRSSFPGPISEIPGISVDNFTGNNVESRAFFISHFHTDHVQGFGGSNLMKHLEKTNASIYTTEITMAIIRNEYKGWNVLKYVKTLNKDYNLITLSSVPEKKIEELLVDVTLIPAGHSLGSTMFLFKIPGKTVLYTGDFRIRINDIPKYSKLHQKNGEPIRIDAMYVDTTFIDKEYEDFAKRSNTVDTVIDEIDKWLRGEANHAVAIYLPANYTFEFIFNRIYQRLKMKVFVERCKWEFYCGIQELVPGITDDPESRIHLCSRKYARSAGRYCDHFDHMVYLHIRLSAIIWSNYNLDHTPINRESDEQLTACFATHCSRRELLSFVEYFAPDKIVGFPNVYQKRSPPITPKPVDYQPSPKRRSSTKKSGDEKRRIASGAVNRKLLL